MDTAKILSKFGNNYHVNDATFVMGIHHRIAQAIALRFVGHKRFLDACCASGFISLAVARVVPEVVAVDINPEHLKMAEENAKMAGVAHKIKFILGDVSSDDTLARVDPIDCANLDMDWAIGEDKLAHVELLSQMIPPADLLFEKISSLTPNISLRLPRELKLSELDRLPAHELQEVHLDNDFKFFVAYFGNLIQTKGRTKLEITTQMDRS